MMNYILNKRSPNDIIIMTDDERRKMEEYFKLLYSKAKIYKITSPHTAEVYIGSTTSTLAQRMTGHISAFKRWKNGKSKAYTSSYKVIEKGDTCIELIENFPCSSLEFLLKREREIIQITNNCCNIQYNLEKQENQLPEETLTQEILDKFRDKYLKDGSFRKFIIKVLKD